ncbi:acyltransferase family protein [Rhodocytophaga aerolata]|uniref:Acyltransferase family protein n=1 Tax=Rhodocytophaga aerolata TaxID=455078 RepID=A0ABT8R118_9BACT|nr:acyltransferase family protein [Rhodocytophaga aerolata]MDO1445785.1 acyltransferase family protein [Rhodocytophaga aerolata]
MLPLQNPTMAPRKYDLDWLRVLAFTLLIFYHTGMFFVSWGWHIKNNEISEAMEWPMRFLSQWRMPLLFMISGAGVYFALGRRPGGTFLAERTKRILVPLIFGMFVVVPPQIYYERLTQGATFSYLEFYPSVLEFQPYPEGNFSWHHLWYLAYIFTYSLLCLPLFLYLRGEKGKQLLHNLSQFISTKAGIYLLMIPLFISEASLRPYWPTNQNLIADWANFTLSLLLFIYGFIICSQENIRQRIEDNRFVSLSIALVTVTILYSYYWIDWPDPSPAGMLLFWAITVTNGWCWLMTIFGFARKYLNFTNPFLKYANEAVYPFYILHQTIIICIAYYMIDWQLSIALKFLIISTGMFLITWFLYEGIIRRIKVLRIVFGLKANATNKHITVPASGTRQVV